MVETSIFGGGWRLSPVLVFDDADEEVSQHLSPWPFKNHFFCFDIGIRDGVYGMKLATDSDSGLLLCHVRSSSLEHLFILNQNVRPIIPSSIIPHRLDISESCIPIWTDWQKTLQSFGFGPFLTLE